jgi:transcriptional regulator with XRE-family HTH domain
LRHFKEVQPLVDTLKSLVDRVQPPKIPAQSYGNGNSLKTAGRSVKSKGKTMILADKIIENRKKNGWSQEELARMLGVSRQSVSKWEGIQAVPDMNKILQMADLFIFPSIYEGLPLSVIEAQAAGIRCLISDAVTTEVDVTGLVTFMSIQNEPSTWATKAVDLAGSYTKVSTYDQVAAAGYDVTKVARFYENL